MTFDMVGYKGVMKMLPQKAALAYSVNTVSVRVLEKAGINHTIELAERMGITSDLPTVPSLALGSADISMIVRGCGVEYVKQGGYASEQALAEDIARYAR